MNIIPLAGFYWRQAETLKTVFGGGTTGGHTSQEVIDFASAVVPVLKKWFPKLNTNGLLDDALSTLKECLATPVAIANQTDH